MSNVENSTLEKLRTEYTKGGLSQRGIADDPLDQFKRWFAEAETAGVLEPNAMTLATVSADGKPSARTVLLKGIDARGFRFFTNFESRKAREIFSRPRAAIVFHWKELERQVTASGTVSKLSDEESETYFHARPYLSQIGAWASRQSSVIATRSVLDKREAHLIKRYPEGSEIPCPEFWGGFVLRPDEVEFWQGRAGRLHDRVAYRRPEKNGEKKWETMRLSP